MNIPIKVDYGVRALVDLAMNGEGKPVRASEIAARTSIPEPYLAQVLHGLSKNGISRACVALRAAICWPKRLPRFVSARSWRALVAPRRRWLVWRTLPHASMCLLAPREKSGAAWLKQFSKS